MARSSRRSQVLALLLVLVPILANAQVLSNLPDLSSSGTSTGGQTTKTASDNTKTDTASTTFRLTDAPSLSTSSNSIFHLSGLPTIAGAGIPTLVIPYTANAPFMQKSSLPEGTFFIAVGATLAFFGACVLLWRALVAWSINRSVKRTALASIGVGGRSEKSGSSTAWTGNNNRTSTGYQQVPRSGVQPSDTAHGSSMSLDHLTSAGKLNKPHFRDSQTPDRQTTPPSSLFFSPTAQARESGTWSSQTRNSAYMPSGFYASPSSSHPAGGAAGQTIGGGGPHHSVAPYAQHQRYSNRLSGMSEPSPPPSPGMAPRWDPRPISGDSNVGSRDSGLRPPSHLYAQPSTSSLMVGQSSVSDLASTANNSRPPSAVLDDIFSLGQHDRRGR